MAGETELRTKNILIKYTMSKAAAEDIKTRFIDMEINGESPSYMDCILFDTALDVLGIEQVYYGIGDEEWQRIQTERKEADKRFAKIKTIDVTDTWKEVLK